jgi:hypothetical protein
VIPVRWVRFLPPPLHPHPRRLFVKKFLLVVIVLALGAVVARKKLTA